MAVILLFAAPSFAEVPGVGVFFDLLQKNKISPTPVGFIESSGEVERPKVPLAISASGKSRSSLPDRLEFRSAYIQGSSMLIDVVAPRTKQTYEITLNSQVRMNAAVKTLLLKAGLSSSEKWLGTDLSIQFRSQDLESLQSLWVDHPEKPKWSEFWDGYELKEGQLSLKLGLINPVHNQEASNVDWVEVPRPAARTLALFGLWLQCGDLVSGQNIKRKEKLYFLDRFDSCLGYGLQSGTPNMFAPNLINNRLQKSRRRTKSILNYNIVARDSEFRLLLQELRASDVLQFLELTDHLDQELIESVFDKVGFPAVYSELVAAKLVTRRNQLVDLLPRHGFLPKNLRRDIGQIGDGQHIVDGVVVQNFPGVRLDLTNSLLERLMQEVAKPALKGLEAQAKDMLANFPYTGVELINFGNSFVGAGILFRLKRLVEKNPEATGPHDRYIVQDTLKLGLTANLGRNFTQARRLNLWMSIGAGYASTFSYRKKVSSVEEAQAQYWMIPYKLVFDSDFTTLKKGESYAVQRGFISIGGGGGNIKYSRKVRPAGYLLFGLNYMNNFQVTRAENEDLYILQGEDDHWTLSAKGFIRVLSKYFRVPFLGLNYRWGRGYSKVFVLPKDGYGQLRGKDHLDFQLLVRNTLEERDVEALSKVIGYTRSDFDYYMRSGFLNFFGNKRSGTYSRGNFDVDFSDDQIERSGLTDGHYFVSKLNNTTTEGKLDASEATGCKTGGVLEYGDEKRTEIIDGIMSFDCNIFTQIRSIGELKRIQEHLSTRVFVPEFAITAFFDTVPAFPYDLHISIKGDVYWPSLHQSLRSGISSISMPGPQKRNRVRRIKQRSPHKNLELLQKLLFDNNNPDSPTSDRNSLLGSYLSQQMSKHIELKMNVSSRESTKSYSVSFEDGEHMNSSAKNYLEWRESTGVRGIIDDY